MRNKQEITIHSTRFPIFRSSTIMLLFYNQFLQRKPNVLKYFHDINVNDTLRMYKNDDIRMYNFDCITDTIVEVITTCNTYTLLTVHLL